MSARMPARAGVPGRVIALVFVGLIAAACGGLGTPGMGGIAGTVGVSVARSTAGTTPRLTGSISGPRIPPAGAPRFAPNELLVKFKPGASLQAVEVHRLAGATEVTRSLRAELHLVQIAPGESLTAVQTRYRSDPRVAYAEPNYYRYPDAAGPSQVIPNDPRYPDQWNLSHINASAAWDITRGSSLVIVAAIDKGVLPHEDLVGVLVGGHDFVDGSSSSTPKCAGTDDAGHGTGVAGVIAAATNNATGVAGVNWGGGSGGTRIMPLQIFADVNGACVTTSARIIAAIEWAADHSARVINMSFGGLPGDPPSQAEQDAVNYAFNAGVILVASAGNNGVDCTVRWPVAYNHVVGVAATTVGDARASYSNFGGCVDVAAPGGDGAAGIPTTWGTLASPSQYAALGGTSFAAPHVAGLAALLIAKGVTGPAAIESVMKSTATNLGSGLGAGLINAGAALGAPGATHPMRVFGGTISGSTITPASAMVVVTSTGAYSLSIVPGTWTVFAWQDSNGDGVVDAGDLYGAVAGISVAAGATVAGVNVAVSEVPPGTPIRTLAGAGAVSR